MLLLGAWGCPDGVLCAARAAERMALLFYLRWLSHKTLYEEAELATNSSALSALQNNLLAVVKTLES